MHYLTRKEIGKASLSRNQKFAADLICSEHSHYEFTWSKASSKPITLLEYAFYNDFSEVYRLDGSLAYRLALPNRGKIKDITGCSNGANDFASCSFIIALTSDSHLAFFNIDTGRLAQYFLLSSRFKFKYIDWNLVNTSLVLRSTIQTLAPTIQATHYIILGIYPTRVLAKFRLRSDLFGTRGTVKIEEGVIYTMSPNNKVECYDLSSLLVAIPGVKVDEILFSADTELPDTHELGISKLVSPTGEKTPPVPLLSLKSENHFLDFSDSRCFYMTKNSNYNIFHLDTGQLVGEIAVTPEIEEEDVGFLRKTNQVVAKQNKSISLYHIDHSKIENNKWTIEEIGNNNKRIKTENNNITSTNNNNADPVAHNLNPAEDAGVTPSTDLLDTSSPTTRVLKKRFEVNIKDCYAKFVTTARTPPTTTAPSTPTRLQRKCKPVSPGKILADFDDKIDCCTFDETLDLMVVGKQSSAYIYNKNGVLVKSVKLLHWNENWEHELSFGSNGEHLIHIAQSPSRESRLATYRLVL